MCGICKYSLRSENNVRSPGITCSCELPDIGAGIKLNSLNLLLAILFIRKIFLLKPNPRNLKNLNLCNKIKFIEGKKQNNNNKKRQRPCPHSVC